MYIIKTFLTVDKATNVIDAGKVIAGLMTSEPEPETTEQPVEAEAAPVEQSQDEDTVNPSDVPYMEQELEQAPAEEAEAETAAEVRKVRRGFLQGADARGGRHCRLKEP